eukprot:scaffold32667_cov45-Phaeocystis_antarctica.AAC.1
MEGHADEAAAGGAASGGPRRADEREPLCRVRVGIRVRVRVRARQVVTSAAANATASSEVRLSGVRGAPLEASLVRVRAWVCVRARARVGVRDRVRVRRARRACSHACRRLSLRLPDLPSPPVGPGKG